MKIISSLNSSALNSTFGLTIGNFDGVHVGHQELIRTVVKNCQAKAIKSVLMTFSPHPQEILNPGKHILINSYEQKKELLKEYGLNFLCEIMFDRNFSTLSPDDFLKNHVFCNKGLQTLFLGHDFVFGANKSGSQEIALSSCKENDVELIRLPKFEFGNKRISSSLVRKAIISGQMEKVNEYLGRNFLISGQVIKGDGRGRKIGFPTANINYESTQVVPEMGVYITNTVIKGMSYYSVTNIGKKPTFVSGGGITIESHILDFDRDIYGENIKICFLRKIRDEKKFNAVNELLDQIELDITSARDYFKEILKS